MKRWIPILVIVNVLALMMVSATALAKPKPDKPAKVDVCHVEGNGGYHLINIAPKTVAKHLAHGDALPGDPVPGDGTMKFDDDCEMVSAIVGIFDSIPAVYPGSFPSLGYQATSTDEFGDHVAFAGTERALQTVDLSLTSWACENDGTRLNTEACVSTPGSSFPHEITLNLYEVDNSGLDPAPGALLGSVTDTFDIPFRPSWDAANCPDPTTDVPFGGTWYDPVLGSCVHGYAFTITFDFSGLVLPDEVIYGVAYDTQSYGATPIGASGPYNSLNVSLTTDGALVGTDVEPDAMFWDTSYPGYTDVFVRDSGWTPYTGVIRFNAS